jgi:hypothetical protein
MAVMTGLVTQFPDVDLKDGYTDSAKRIETRCAHLFLKRGDAIRLAEDAQLLRSPS